MSLQKIRGQLQDKGAPLTIAHDLALLEEAFLVASLQTYTERPIRRRAAPPKLVTPNDALLAVDDPDGATDPARFGAWVENASLAHAWNSDQNVSSGREEPVEVDAVLGGSWGKWALAVKTGRFRASDLAGLLAFCRRFPDFKPLVLCHASERTTTQRAMIPAIPWPSFLLDGVAGVAGG